MSSRTAACGQPPVSMARIRDGERALCLVRNSASSLFCFRTKLAIHVNRPSLRKHIPYLVKISFVTAAMLYSSRSFRHNASMRAVFPDPTGLFCNCIYSQFTMDHPRGKFDLKG